MLALSFKFFASARRLGPLRRVAALRVSINGWTYCAAFLASCVFCWRSFSSSEVIFGGTSLIVSLSTCR
jgi:hypothetical protein